jgi:hypothetical protein
VHHSLAEITAFIFLRARDNDDRDVAGQRVGRDLVSNDEAVEPRQAQIEHDRIDARLIEQRNRTQAVPTRFLPLCAGRLADGTFTLMRRNFRRSGMTHTCAQAVQLRYTKWSVRVPSTTARALQQGQRVRDEPSGWRPPSSEVVMVENGKHAMTSAV